MSFTNEQFIELVTDFVKDLRPDKPVSAGIGKLTRDGKTSEFMYLRLTVERGAQTEIRFKKSDLLGLSEAHIKVFLTGKLAGIGVAVAQEREIAAAVSETPEEYDGSVTAAEQEKLREMLNSRADIKAPGQEAARTRVEDSLKVENQTVPPQFLYRK